MTPALPFALDLAVSIDDAAWQEIFPNAESRAVEIARRALAEACRAIGLSPPEGDAEPLVEISLLLTDDAAIRVLNRDYRGKDAPTNVLSFPGNPLTEQELDEALLTGEPLLLGDVVMARETLLREAAAQGKLVADHIAHLLVHGVLHLAGFDHIEENDAAEMENLEIAVLRHLHIANPYETDELPSQEIPDKK